MSSRTRFGKGALVVCMAALAACTSQEQGGEVSGQELAVFFPGGTFGDFQIGRVTVSAQCSGDGQNYPQNESGDYIGDIIPSQPDPDGDGIGGGTQFITDLEFENDDQGGELWHTFEDQLGVCQYLVEAFEPDGEKFCVGTGGGIVEPGELENVFITIACDVSQRITTGRTDLQGTTITGVGNFCPLLNSLDLIPDDIPITANELYPIQDTTEFWVCGGDFGDIGEQDIGAYVLSGGQAGALASCTDLLPNDPAYVEAFDRCDGPDPRRVTLTCTAELIDALGGNVTGPSMGTFSDPNDQDADGDPTTYNGLCLNRNPLLGGLLPDSFGFFTCNSAADGPGALIRITCAGDDGDEDCLVSISHDLTCPGLNNCVPVPADCTDPDPDDCLAPDVCDPALGTCLPFVNEPDGQSCLGNPGQGGGIPGECLAGTCVDEQLCQPGDCSDGNDCTQDLCDPAVGPPSGCSNPNEQDGTSCQGGNGTCVAGVCQGLCFGITCPPNTTQCVSNVCDPADGQCRAQDDAPGTPCDSGGGPGSGQCDGAGVCEGPATFALAGEFRAYNSLLKPEGDPVTCVGAPPGPTSVGGPVPAGPPVGTCTDPDLTTVPGSNTGAGAGIDTQCISTPGIGGTMEFDDSASPIVMTGVFTLDFAIDATVDLSAPDCATILNVVIATSSVNDVSGEGTGSVSDGGSLTLTDPGDGFNVDYIATGAVNCAGAPPAFEATVCNLAGGLLPGDNPLPLPGDPGRRFWPVITFQDTNPTDGFLEMQYATGPTTTAGWAMNNPPALSSPGTQFIATTGVQQ